MFNDSDISITGIHRPNQLPRGLSYRKCDVVGAKENEYSTTLFKELTN